MPTVVMVNAPDSLLDERRRLGLDTSDEMWDGVIHLVPPAGSRHGRLQAELFAPLTCGLETLHGPLFGGTEVGVFRPGVDDDYRVPDLAYASASNVTERGIEGHALLVVEIRSPGDEAFKKLPFFCDVGVDGYLIIDTQKQTIHPFNNRDGIMVEQAADQDSRWTLPRTAAQIWFGNDALHLDTGDAQHHFAVA